MGTKRRPLFQLRAGPARRRNTDPWRTVSNIGETTGARGGKAWSLTLECGHIAIRHQAPTTFRRAMAGKPTPFAPRRVRCWMCGAKERHAAGAST